ncbi:lysophospholipid acyltransferase LPEAT1-like isoform X3 [Prosopis cineraria]|uniref:lysophospholipid acyltransferase LPEAT1-like isoform X3 n=1 Tax=Prosopis cineraria TaxID=364024 RepID=UPI002410480C|nr:lysophospholipid acyltransferase LPEAT1-like isoform X3 [Prosopis cineraria]
MECELKVLNSKPPKSSTKQPDPICHVVSTADDRPLLNSNSSVSSNSLREVENKFAPFVRRDVYGAMGRGPLPMKEKLLLALALLTLAPIRVVLIIAILILYNFICRICTLFSVPYREDGQEDYAHLGGWRRSVIVWFGKALPRLILFVLGFYWISETYRTPHTDDDKPTAEKKGKNQSEEIGRPGVIISNHVSYLDILYHMSSSFPSFVAKRSVAKLPLVGLISKCLGCIYVQRESKSSDFKGVSGVVTERIQEAHQNKVSPMLLFPEGTTTNGNFLLPFKTGGFLASAPVLPVILKYPYQRFSPAWDSISGVRHIVFLLCQFVNHLEVTRLPVYCPSQLEKDDPKLYANNVRSLMAAEGNLILSDIALAEKRIYLASLDGNNSPPSVMHQKDD